MLTEPLNIFDLLAAAGFGALITALIFIRMSPPFTYDEDEEDRT